MKHSIILLTLLFAASPLYAEQGTLQPHPDGTCGTIHRLLHDETERTALASYQGARAAGQLPANPAGKSGLDHEVGDTLVFNVSGGLSDGGINPGGGATNASDWQPTQFVLIAQEDGVANVWLELRFATNLSDEQADAVRTALLRQTPSESINPSAGIIENNDAIWGEAPDYDGDGTLDILIYQILNPGIGGFVTATDIWPDAPAGVGNQRDVLYLDAESVIDGDIDALMFIAAHEYTHMIHYNYDLNPFTEEEREHIFFSEGLAEYGGLMNGYQWEPRYDLTLMSLPTERNRSLFSFRAGEPLAWRDYVRGGLFFSYYADLYGPEAVGAVLRNPKVRLDGLREELQAQGGSLETFILDFHTANLINDTSVDPRYGYESPLHEDVGAEFDPYTVVRGDETAETPDSDVWVAIGGVEYLLWDRVENFNLRARVSSNNPQMIEVARLRVVLDHADGSREVRDLPVGETEQSYSFDGAYDRISLIAAHVRGSESFVDPIQVHYDANWDSKLTAARTFYDDGFGYGTVASTDLFGIREFGKAAYATRFEPPQPEAQLEVASVAPFYRSQFSDGGALARDGATRLHAEDLGSGCGRKARRRTPVDRRSGPPSLQLRASTTGLRPGRRSRLRCHRSFGPCSGPHTAAGDVLHRAHGAR